MSTILERPMPKTHTDALIAIKDARCRMRQWALGYRRIAKTPRAKAITISEAIAWRNHATQIQRDWIT